MLPDKEREGRGERKNGEEHGEGEQESCNMFAPVVCCSTIQLFLNIIFVENK